MRYFFYKIKFLLVILLFNLSLANAQTEYLVFVNPTNAAITKIDSIPGVKWLKSFYISTYNQNNLQYTFIGGDNANGTAFKLFTLDAVSGNIISNPLFVNHLSFYALQYSRLTNILYGIIRNSGVFSIVTINTLTGTYATVQNIIGLSSVSKFLVDDVHNRFFVIGPDNIGDLTLLTIDIASGNIISQVHTPKINNLLYDNLTNKLYALSNRSSPPPGHTIFSICNVDPATGIIANIADLPNLAVINSGNETFNEYVGVYIFSATTFNDTANYLYSVNINTGNIISKVSIPTSSTLNNDNLVFFRFDNVRSAKLYALYWEAKTIKTPIDSSCKLELKTKIYPNPFADVLYIDKNSTTCNVTMNLYNELGQLLVKDKIINDGHNEIPLSNISSGIYFYDFISNGNILLSGSIFKH